MPTLHRPPDSLSLPPPQQTSDCVCAFCRLVSGSTGTRRTGLLLKDVLSSPRRANHLISCHEHNVRERTPLLISSLYSRKSVALVSDAGTPCISDPGRHLVSAAIAANIPIVPVPGACAALSALVCTGFSLDSFTFVGFLPSSGSARTAALARVQTAPGAVVLYEAPHRLLVTLKALADTEGPGRALCVGRELTKRFEEFRRFPTVTAAVAWYEASDTPPRGEFSLVLGPRPQPPVASHLDEIAGKKVDVRGIALALLREGVPVRAIAKSISGVAEVPKKAVYGYVTHLKTELARAIETGTT